MITGTWSGLDEAIRKVSALGREVGEADVMEPTLLSLGRELRDDIVRTAPRSQIAPHMADEFVATVSREAREAGRTSVLVGPRGKGTVGFVAGFVEFGTSKMGARPFIRPAADAFTPRFPRALAEGLRARFDRIVRKYAGKAK